MEPSIPIDHAQSMRGNILSQEKSQRAAELATEEEQKRVVHFCSGCNQSWGKSRKIDYEHRPEIKNPYSPGCVISIQSSRNNMPEALFKMLQYRRLGWGGRRLVTEFEYDKSSGQVYYDPAAQELEECCYARLITQNSWYISLFSSMVFVVLNAADIQSNLTLCISLFIDGSFHEIGRFARCAFVVVWVGVLLATLIVAFREASHEWKIKSSALVGDIIEDHEVDSWSSFFCLVMLRWCLVEMRVKDIPIMLHPWKAMQPYAAIKMETTRAFIVGFESEHSFRVQNQAGQELVLPLQLISKLTLVAMKAWIAFHIEYHRISLVVSSLATILAMLLLMRKSWQLWVDRRKFKNDLVSSLDSQTVAPHANLHRAEAGGACASESANIERTQSAVSAFSAKSAMSLTTTGSIHPQNKSFKRLIERTQCQKLLAQHYHVEIKDGKEISIDLDKWIERMVWDIQQAHHTVHDMCAKCCRIKTPSTGEDVDGLEEQTPQPERAQKKLTGITEGSESVRLQESEGEDLRNERSESVRLLESEGEDLRNHR